MPEEAVPLDAAPVVGAAILASRHGPERVLEVVVDAGIGTIHVSLLDHGLVAFGATSGFLRPHGSRAATVVARIPMRFAAQPDTAVPFFDVNVAITWAFVGDGPGSELDVAGTAYVFCPGDIRPEEFRARRRDDFNALRLDESSAAEAPADAERVREASASLLRRPRRASVSALRSLIDPSGMMWPPAGGRSSWRAVARVRRAQPN